MRVTLKEPAAVGVPESCPVELLTDIHAGAWYIPNQLGEKLPEIL